LPFVAVSLWPLLRSLALVAAVIVVVFIHQNGTLNNKILSLSLSLTLATKESLAELSWLSDYCALY